jgi:hypothetical protein
MLARMALDATRGAELEAVLVRGASADAISDIVAPRMPARSRTAVRLLPARRPDEKCLLSSTARLLLDRAEMVASSSDFDDLVRKLHCHYPFTPK